MSGDEIRKLYQVTVIDINLNTFGVITTITITTITIATITS